MTSPALTSWRQTSLLRPWDQSVGWLSSFFPFACLKGGGAIGRAASSCPSSHDGAELVAFAGGTGKARRSGRLRPCTCSLWARHPVDANLCFDATLGSCWELVGCSVQKHSECVSVSLLSFFCHSNSTTAHQAKALVESDSSSHPLVSPGGVETSEHHVTASWPGPGGFCPGSTTCAGRAPP